MRIIILGLLSCCTIHMLAAVPRSNTQDQIQTLYKQITNELINIRKDFAGAQPKVYTILDQVDKMNNLTKAMYQKRLALESQMNNSSSNTKSLREENKTLKAEVSTLKQKLDVTTKFLEHTNKQLNSEKQRAAKHSKEKKDLQGKISQIESEKNVKALDEKIKEKVNKTVEAEVAAQLKNLTEAQAQSLSLTSTSAPNSPR